MIVDARNAKRPKKHRPYTARAAVEIFLDGMQVGDTKPVSVFKDQFGRDLPRGRFDTILNLMLNGRRFTVRKSLDGAVLFNVTRLS